VLVELGLRMEMAVPVLLRVSLAAAFEDGMNEACL